MGYFYFDETIQEIGGFIVGAFVYASNDLTLEVFAAIGRAGLSPGIDEFKSGCRMDRNPKQAELRGRLSSILASTSIGIVVLPVAERALLGREAILGLEKMLVANGLDQELHNVFLDEGIVVDRETQQAFAAGIGALCELHSSQDSKTIGGIQLADLVAHSLGGMLLEQLGLKSKMVRAGEGSGYDPDLEVELGFELWASLRYQFFRAPYPKPGAISDDPIGDMIFDVENYGLHISAGCVSDLREAALKRFGDCYLGCIH